MLSFGLGICGDEYYGYLQFARRTRSQLNSEATEDCAAEEKSESLKNRKAAKSVPQTRTESFSDVIVKAEAMDTDDAELEDKSEKEPAGCTSKSKEMCTATKNTEERGTGEVKAAECDLTQASPASKKKRAMKMQSESSGHGKNATNDVQSGGSERDKDDPGLSSKEMKAVADENIEKTSGHFVKVEENDCTSQAEKETIDHKEVTEDKLNCGS